MATHSSERYAITFSASSLLSAGSYLNYAGISTSSIPFVIPENCNIMAWSVGSNGVQVNTSLVVQQNGNALFSVPLINQQFNTINAVTYPLNQNDQISVVVNGISVTSSFSLTLFLQVI